MKKKELNQLKVTETTDEQSLKEALKLRQEVFVKEQKVPAKLEFDGKDKEAIHFVAFLADEVVGTCRLLMGNGSGKLERMAVKKEWRGYGIGSALLAEVIKTTKKTKLSQISIHAQLQAKDFYLNQGFKAVNEEIFVEAGIEHIKMNMKL
ncbi:GNAT family N-acetyltransferase [Natroniella sulfidigena]|uniref:GNAT family N-acetyltransferase n=1 Tax=Natroniella sulfidigena TaxID=723921 RepID=UPI00200ADE37|nr:GNAT family N-acetyltransferase [Natroniella sulfidigena]